MTAEFLHSPEQIDVLARARKLLLTDPKAAESLLSGYLKEGGGSPEAYFLLTNVYDHMGQRKSALKATHDMLATLDRLGGSVHDVQGFVDRWRVAACNNLCRFGEELKAFSIAQQAYDRLGRPLGLAPAYLFVAQAVGHFSEIARLAEALGKGYEGDVHLNLNETPRSSTIWCGNPEINVRVAKVWRQSNLPPMANNVAFAERVSAKIRVGYLSGDFRNHPTSRLVKGLLKNHDRSRFEVFLFCSGWDDGSNLRKEVVSYVDAVHSVAELSDLEASQLIRRLNIDILVELNGPTRAHRLGILAHRVAPVQIGYLGFPGSYGGDLVDYIIADKNTIPPQTREFYPERIIYVSGTYQVNDYEPLPESGVADTQLGLPDRGDGQLLGVFNRSNKITLEAWNAWCSILRQVPSATLCILDPGKAVAPSLRAHAKNQKLRAGQIRLLPGLTHSEHLMRLTRFDLMLDTWPYGGHTTTADALWAGVPVVAMECDSFAGRVSSGLLKAGGLGALVATDPKQYVGIATRLLLEPEALQRAKKWVSEKTRRSIVFDSLTRTREIEEAYLRCLESTS